MNVENRKLFANRDARRRLAEMGGIMASSPELLGEAQLYGLGGDVSVEEYVAVIPGINSGRPIRLKMETLARLQELAPELMQQAFVMDQATAEQRGVDVMRLRPGDAFVERQVIEASPTLGVQTAPMQAPGMDASPGYMSALDASVPNTGLIPVADMPIVEPMADDSMLMSGATQSMDKAQRLNLQSNLPITAPPPAPAQAPVSSVRDVPGFLDTVAETSPTNPARNFDLIRSVNQSARGGEFADWLNSVGQAGIDAVSDAMTTVAGAGLSADAELGMAMSIAAGYLGFPEKAAEWSKAARDEMSYAQDMLAGDIDILGTPQGDAAFTVPEAGRRMKEAARVQGIIDRAGENSPLLAEGSVSEPLNDIPMSIIEARRMPGPEGIMMEAPTQSAAPSSSVSDVTRPGDMSTPTMPGMPSMPGVDVSTGVPMTMSEVEQRMFDERMAAADAGLTNTQTAEDRFPAEDVIRAEQEKALDLIRANEMARNERLQMTGFEETAARNAEAAKAERDAEQAAEEAPDQPAPPPAGADQQAPTTRPQPRPDLLPEIDKVAGTDAPPSDKSNAAANLALGEYGLAKPGEKLSPKETVSRYEKLFKEMLGEDDEDKAKEMWHNMAMIGFAIASGESPRALQNIANGLLAGTKMMKEDRASQRKREDAITTMAIEAGLEDQRAALKYARDLAVAGVKSSSDRSEYLYNTVYGEAFKSHLENNPGDYTGASEAALAAAKAAAPTAPNAGGGSTGSIKYIVGQKYKIEGKDYTYKGGNSDDPSSWSLAE